MEGVSETSPAFSPLRLVSMCHVGIFTVAPDAMVTVNEVLPLKPFSEAEIVVEPEAKALASPELLIVAMAVFATVQVAEELTFAVEPLLYVAVAVNC